MITDLRIQNIILVDDASITFGKGFNVLTGETGAGKSAIIEALALTLGERADSSVIRRGSDTAIVEALFDVSNSPAVNVILKESGIDVEEQLLIRREITSTGKNKVFINHSPATLSLLKKLNTHLVRFISQHANRQLFSLDYHRKIVDVFGSLQSKALEYYHSWSHQKQLLDTIESIRAEEAQRLRQMEVCKREIEEITSLKIEEGEDESLFAEYTKLNNAGELYEALSHAHQMLHGGQQSVISQLKASCSYLSEALKFDESLQETLQLLETARTDLQEASYSMTQSLSSYECQPGRAEEVNQRLSDILKIKKKYGPDLADVQSYCERQIELLDRLENADHHIEKLERELDKQSKQTDFLANELSSSRKKAAKQLQASIQTQLRDLEMPNVVFEIKVEKAARNASGDDLIEFYMAPNPGEAMVPIKECASGGELSRLLLSLQVLLAGKDQISSIVFDEIDANIGGKTAVSVGNKLVEIGQKHQVICITHFPQVAELGHFHFQISKQTELGRTKTIVQPLKGDERKSELERMVGGKKVFA